MASSSQAIANVDDCASFSATALEQRVNEIQKTVLARVESTRREFEGDLGILVNVLEIHKLLSTRLTTLHPSGTSTPALGAAQDGQGTPPAAGASAGTSPTLADSPPAENLRSPDPSIAAGSSEVISSHPSEHFGRSGRHVEINRNSSQKTSTSNQIRTGELLRFYFEPLPNS